MSRIVMTQKNPIFRGLLRPSHVYALLGILCLGCGCFSAEKTCGLGESPQNSGDFLKSSDPRFDLGSPLPAASVETSYKTVAEKDTYINSYYPSNNYGGQDWILIGDFMGMCEAYFQFNFTDKPAVWKRAEISIDLYSISATTQITITLITASWEEYGLTWLNKPAHGPIITQITAAASQIYRFDVSPYIEGRTALSICINSSTVAQTGYIQGTAREGVYSFSPEDAPTLHWVVDAEFSVTAPAANSVLGVGTHSIQWIYIGPSFANVRIELYKDGLALETIYYSTPNDGEHTWQIYSFDDYNGGGYQLRLSDYNDASICTLSGVFSIDMSAHATDSDEDSSGKRSPADPEIDGYIPFFVAIVSLFALGVVAGRKYGRP